MVFAYVDSEMRKVWFFARKLFGISNLDFPEGSFGTSQRAHKQLTNRIQIVERALWFATEYKRIEIFFFSRFTLLYDPLKL